MKVLRVAIDVPLPQLFDYRCGDAGHEDIGRRVLVPFGKKKVVGIIVEVAENSELDPEKLRAAECILRDALPLAADWMPFPRPSNPSGPFTIPPSRKPTPYAPSSLFSKI